MPETFSTTTCGTCCAGRWQTSTFRDIHSRLALLSVRALELGIARSSRNFTEWDGNSSSRRSRVSRYASYTLSRALSPTRLERWAACPFSYFLGNVLRIGSIETPEDVFSISPLERGSLIHNILDEFMKRVDRVWNDAPAARGLER